MDNGVKETMNFCKNIYYGQEEWLENQQEEGAEHNFSMLNDFVDKDYSSLEGRVKTDLVTALVFKTSC